MQNDGTHMESGTAGSEHPDDVPSCGKTHWSGRPLPLLASVLAVRFFIYLAQSALGLPMFYQQTADPAAQLTAAILFDIAAIAVTLLAGGLFFFGIRLSQTRHGCKEPVSRKLGIAFWTGIALLLGYAALTLLESFQYHPELSVANFMSLLATGLTNALFLVLLVPVLERRFGIIRGALLLSAAYALLAVLELLIRTCFSAWVSAGQGLEILANTMWSGLFISIPSNFLVAAAYGVAAVACYHAASRRVPGTWVLFTAILGLIPLPLGFINSLFTHSNATIKQLVHPFYFLLVFAVSMAILAGFQRWKTPQEFREGMKELSRKLKATQDIE